MTPDPVAASEDDRTRSHRLFLAIVGVLTTIVLIATAGGQLHDSNLVTLPEATGILAGDHPYRDFFEWGAPLAAYLSAAAQLLVGYRLIGEFLLQWLFIVGGVVIAFHLGLRLSRSTGALLAVLPLVLLLLAETPTYHYSKLFFFPLTIWLAWRYLDRPGMVRSALIGVASAVGFLFRHDYGVYAAITFVAAMALSSYGSGASRFKSMALDATVCGLSAAVLVLPWAFIVQVNEGLVDYVHTRSAMYEKPKDAVVYASLFGLNPLLALTPSSPPAPKAATVGFFWKDSVNETLRHEVEGRHGLRSLGERDAEGRWKYEVANVYDMGLFELDPYITDGAGFDWDRLNEMRWHVPGRDNAIAWLQQITLVIPLLLLGSAGVTLWRRRNQADADLSDAKRMVLAGLFLAVVDSALLQLPSYSVIVAPLTFALGARLLVGNVVLVRAGAIAVLLLTSVATVVWARESLLFRPSDVVASMPGTFAQLMASPPDEADQPFRYLRNCTAPGDHLLVTGMTPFQVNYYAQRPFAGGHLYWRTGWRSTPLHEAKSLALLQQQSVPFAVSTRPHLLDDFTRYPHIRSYLQSNYKEVEGSDGRILFDARRVPTGRFGKTGMPCFH